MAGEIIVSIAEMPPNNQEKCSGCPAVARFVLPPSLCRIALSEKELGKKLRLWQIAGMEIDIRKVPIDCPNGY